LARKAKKAEEAAAKLAAAGPAVQEVAPTPRIAVAGPPMAGFVFTGPAPIPAVQGSIIELPPDQPAPGLGQA
jgi:hypothetical protein